MYSNNMYENGYNNPYDQQPRNYGSPTGGLYLMGISNIATFVLQLFTSLTAGFTFWILLVPTDYLWTHISLEASISDFIRLSGNVIMFAAIASWIAMLFGTGKLKAYSESCERAFKFVIADIVLSIIFVIAKRRGINVETLSDIVSIVMRTCILYNMLDGVNGLMRGNGFYAIADMGDLIRKLVVAEIVIVVAGDLFTLLSSSVVFSIILVIITFVVEMAVDVMSVIYYFKAAKASKL